MKASNSMRIWFAFVGMILWVGIYLTGFSKTSWVLYVPAAGFIIGAIAGICPSLTIISKLLDFNTKRTSNQ